MANHITQSRPGAKPSFLAEISHSHAVRALDLQERAVEQLRSRAGTLVAASSLTASFLGAQTIQRVHGIGWLETLALVALALNVALALYVLLPKRGFVFGVSGPGAYESLYEHVDDPDEIQRRLCYWLEGYWRSNQAKIERLTRVYAVATAALVAQLLLWSAALAGTV